jgi:hypothetical protein
MTEEPSSTRVRPSAGDLPRAFRASAPERTESGTDPVAAAFERGRAEGRIEGRDEATAEYVRSAEALRSEVARSLKHVADLEETLVRRHRQAMIDPRSRSPRGSCARRSKPAIP